MAGRVLVTGASGFVGAALVPALRAAGHEVATLGRGIPRGPLAYAWDPERGTIDAAALDGVEGVVHLAGAGIAVRWTPEAMRRIRDSRVRGTRLLAEAMAAHPRPPATFVSASAIGWYGERGEERLDESSAPGDGFLPEVCRAWEAAADPARTAGIRVVHPRFGIVLAPGGGALARMLPLFRLGLGGPFGDGRAWWSWIAMPDLVGILVRALHDATLAGAVNAVAPEPSRNAAFARTLGRVLGRPAWLPVPPVALTLVFKGMARESLLASTCVRPGVLAARDHRFAWPDLEPALRALLARPEPARG